MMGQETRNKLTDDWPNHDIKKGSAFAILTNVIHQEYADIGVKEHKEPEGLKSILYSRRTLARLISNFTSEQTAQKNQLTSIT